MCRNTEFLVTLSWILWCVFVGKQYLMLNTRSEASRFERDMALQLYLSPELSFVPTTMSYSQWSDNYRTKVWDFAVRSIVKSWIYFLDSVRRVGVFRTRAYLFLFTVENKIMPNVKTPDAEVTF